MLGLEREYIRSQTSQRHAWTPETEVSHMMQQLENSIRESSCLPSELPWLFPGLLRWGHIRAGVRTKSITDTHPTRPMKMFYSDQISAPVRTSELLSRNMQNIVYHSDWMKKNQSRTVTSLQRFVCVISDFLRRTARARQPYLLLVRADICVSVYRTPKVKLISH